LPTQKKSAFSQSLKSESDKLKLEKAVGKSLVLNGFDPVKYVINAQKQDMKPFMQIYSSKVV
jgi:hypothetical protein